mmetsp:Transcript_25417/g.40336  ORF Transcript_25417/g.40336 Transcript_25417/m.40336 type:complete len:81 (-) Transcript_25417:653-895(-)
MKCRPHYIDIRRQNMCSPPRFFFFFFWSVSVMRIAQRALFHAAGEETPTAVPLPHGSAKHALSRQPKHSAFNTKYSQSLI